MSNIKFSQLPLATTINSGDIFTLVEEPQLINKVVTYQTLANQIIATIPTSPTSFVHLSGDTMTGYLTLNADPVTGLNAATKQYVDAVAVGIPIGTVLYFAASSAPPGWFECNGSFLNTASFPDLFAVIGYTYGGGGVSFNLPDLRGEFVRGWDHGKGVDSNRVFGTTQADAFQGHWHHLYAPQNPGGNAVIATSTGTPSTPLPATLVQDPATDGVNGVPRTDIETRPVNVALLPCIKYSSVTQVSQIGLSAQQLISYIASLSSQIPNSKSVAKAWVTFAGQTTVPGVSASYNIASVTKNSTGNFTIYFTTSQPDAKYAIFLCDDWPGVGVNYKYVVSQSANSFTIQYKDSGAGGNVYDPPFASVVVFGN